MGKGKNRPGREPKKPPKSKLKPKSNLSDNQSWKSDDVVLNQGTKPHNFNRVVQV